MTLLAGVDVVEFATTEFVQYAGRLLASLGASVTKIEPPDGDPLRRRGPFARTTLGNERSVPFEYLNADKQSVIIDDQTADGQGVLHGLLDGARICLLDAEAVNAGAADGSVPRGQLRVVAGTYGGRPHEPASSTAFTRFHAAGQGYLCPADMDMSVRPGASGPFVFECIYGTGLLVATLAELFRSDGGEVDFSAQAYGVWLAKMQLQRVTTKGVDVRRDSYAYPFGGNLQCRDGYAAVFAVEEHQWRNLCRCLDRVGWIEDPRYATGVLRTANRAEIDAALRAWCASRTVDEALAALQESDVPCGRVRSPEQLLTWPDLMKRGFFTERDSAFGRLFLPQLPFGPRVSAAPVVPAPLLGEVTA